MASEPEALHIELLESSFDLLAPRADELAERFYERLFAVAPQTREMFPADLEAQKRALVASLVIIVRSLRSADVLGLYLEGLGKRHRGYGAVAAHYPVVGMVLLETLAEMAGDAWTAELEAAWADAFRAVSDLMLRAGGIASEAAA
jgi:nitric oxide dioxygenase